MIKICSFSIGNGEESFCFNDFSEGINIIHSDDNNKGKTIVSQGIFYALGNTPNFPAGFEKYEEYYYLVEINVNGKQISVCRKKNFFMVKDSTLKSYDSVNDFKRYFSGEIFNLPDITKNGILQPSGIELFFEMVFLPQDNRSSSNICNRGRYNKDDYCDFIYSYMKCSKHIDPHDIELCKSEIRRLEENRKVLKKSSSLLKSKKLEASFATYTVSKARIDEKLKEVEKCKDSITELVSSKNRLLNKITKNEILLKEINSLNKELETGKLICSVCGSDKIFFESKESVVKFEITDVDIRNQIKKIINNRIQVAREDIQDIESRLVVKQKKLAELMSDKEVTIENLLFYKKDIVQASLIDSQIFDIDQEIEKLRTKIDESTLEIEKGTKSKEEINLEFINYMRYFYNNAEPDDPLEINDIFTKNSINYSGCQGALFMMSKLYAASKLMKIDFPIYIDHFRGGEISTLKEEKIIKIFKELNKQIILSCTLKNEENNKYSHNPYVHAISFDNIEKFHLLSSKYNEEFEKKLKDLMIDLSIQK